MESFPRSCTIVLEFSLVHGSEVIHRHLGYDCRLGSASAPRESRNLWWASDFADIVQRLKKSEVFKTEMYGGIVGNGWYIKTVSLTNKFGIG